MADRAVLTKYFLIIFSILFVLSANSANAASLRSLIRKEIKSPSTQWPEQTARHLEEHQVLFVAGFDNADIRLYAEENIEAIHNISPDTIVSKTNPSSTVSIEDNAEILYGQIQALHLQNDKPLIIVAHSKGAAEIFHMLTQHPELMRNGVIGQTIMVQGAMGGTYLANLAMDILDEEKEQFLGIDVEAILKSIMRRSIDPEAVEDDDGIQSLQTKVSRARVDDSINNMSEEDFALLNSHVQFVTAYQWGPRVSNFLKAPFYFIKAKAGGFLKRNDGVLTLKQQKVKNCGQILAKINNADHQSLFSGEEMLYLDDILKIHAFTRALFMYSAPL